MSTRGGHKAAGATPRMQSLARTSLRSVAKVHQRRSERFEPRTFDADADTVEAVFATETPVDRYYGTETLQCSEAAIDRSQLIGAPVLDSHNQRSTQSIVGRIESAIIEGRKLVGVIRFSRSPEGQQAKAKVAEGMIRSTSVGYRILKFQEKRTGDGEVELLATRWRPHEVSLTPVPADPNAKIRSREGEMMDDDELEVIEAEAQVSRTRSQSRLDRELASLREHATRVGFSEDDVGEMFEGVRSVDQARSAIFGALSERSFQVPTSPARAFHGAGAANETRALAIDAITVRLGGAPTGEGANPFTGRSVVGIMRGLLEGSGTSTSHLSDGRIAEMMTRSSGGGEGGTRAMHTTSDFPALLMESGNRALLSRFAVQLTPLKSFSTKRNARDYRPQSFIRPGEAPALLPRTEAGEIKSGTLSEEKHGLQLKNFGRIFSMSREAVINDDLGAFADFIGAFAEAGATTEGDRFFDLLSANNFRGASLPDGKNWFHSDHGNLASAASALSVASLSEARTAMQLQKNVNGTGRAGAVPAVILVGPHQQTLAEQIVASLTPSQISEVNPFAGKLRVEVETRYDGNGWWLFADPATRPAFMHGYLDGLDGPQIETQEGWRVPGIEFRCMLDFGCGIYDWRAAHFNPGQ